MSADVIRLPVPKFVIGDDHCRAAGPDGRTICLGRRGHGDDHAFRPFDGCYVRVPFGDGLVRFGGFAW